jgi:MFS family permease
VITEIEAQPPTHPDQPVVTRQQSGGPVRPEMQIDSRRNFLAFAGDMLSFMTGLSFIPATIVLVGMASRLTDDKALLGVVAMTGAVAWFLPQIIAARIVHGKRRQKVYLVTAALIGRQTYLLMAIWLLVTRAESPLLTVWLLIGCIGIFHLCDSLAGVAWFDMLSRALSPRTRARSIAIGNFLGLVAGIGAGVIVERVLAPNGLPFPVNYAIIMICAWVCFIISFISILFIQETPMSEAEHSQTTDSHFFANMLEAVRTDPVFQRLIVARIFTGMETMAAAFYVVFIRERLQLPDSALGVFTIAAVVGGILGIAFFGWLGDRLGSRGVIRSSVALQVLGPTLALSVAALPVIPNNAPDLAYGLLIVVIAINSAVAQAGMLGFQGYPLDAAPERHRAMYIGVLNSMGGVVAVTPLLGGLLLDGLTKAVSSDAAYSVVFGIAVLCVVIGLGVSLSLPKPARDV